jgi:ABC-type phosphate/phosphonate transport system substrate-binding protein
VKQYRSLIIKSVIAFILVEAIAIFYAVFWGAQESHKIIPIRVIRVGIVPDISRKFSMKEWSNFLELFNDNKEHFIIKPYFAHSYDELEVGLLNGSLDFININPALFLKLKKQSQVKALAVRVLSEVNRNKFRSVLVTNTGVEFLSETKGLRITFLNENSLTGYIIPYYYLRRTLNVPDLNDWFAKIEFAPTKAQAMVNMLMGETDIVAFDSYSLAKVVDYLNIDDQSYRKIWVSRLLPTQLLCYNSDFEKKNPMIMERIKNQIESNERIINYSKKLKGINFALVEKNNLYKEKMESFSRYLRSVEVSNKLDANCQ